MATSPLPNRAHADNAALRDTITLRGSDAARRANLDWHATIRPCKPCRNPQSPPGSRVSRHG